MSNLADKRSIEMPPKINFVERNKQNIASKRTTLKKEAMNKASEESKENETKIKSPKINLGVWRSRKYQNAGHKLSEKLCFWSKRSLRNFNV